jgi:hypothetical protein
MATYTSAELKDDGILLKEDLDASTTYTVTISGKSNLSGSCYMFLETTPHLGSIGGNLSGSMPATSSFLGMVVDNKTNAGGEIIEDYKMGIILDKEGSSTFDLTPASKIDKTKVRVKATGNIGCEIV